MPARRSDVATIQEQDYRHFFDLSADLLWIMDLDGHLLQANAAWKRLLDRHPERIVGRHLHSFVHPDDLSTVRDILAGLQGGGTEVDGESRFLSRDGDFYWMSWWAVKGTDDDRVFGLAHDVTGLKAANDEVRRLNQHALAMIEGAHEAIVSFGPDQRIVYVNAAAERMFGTDKRRLLGSEFTQVLPTGRRRAYLDEMERYASQGQSDLMGPSIEFEAIRADGVTFPIEMGLSHWESLDDERYTAIIRDISERKQAEERFREAARKMQEANRELEQFAYIASHDLREPLGIVRSYAQLVRRRLERSEDKALSRYVDFINDGTERMYRLVNDLLAFSRVETRGRLLQPVDSNKTIHVALARLDEAIRESGAEITMGTLPMVNADEEQLAQLFQGLIRNAIEFHGEAPPRVHVWASEDEDPHQVRFHVRDQGLGIAPEHHERIFQLFQRLDGHQAGRGSGIGLAICKKIVQRHGGRIGVGSEAGQGATFWFTMPKAS